jgi:spore germination cell wall hydrolase CwlJ-like protein
MKLLHRLILVLAICFSTLSLATESELKCLAKNIYHESRGEGLKGQVAVALVTLNRTKHDDFPDTVCGVVYEKGQFSWTSEKLKITDREAWQDSIQLAKGILYNGLGSHLLPNFKALYFHSSKVKPRWKHKSRPQKIGNHVFY